jgi:hypothetical protein
MSEQELRAKYNAATKDLYARNTEIAELKARLEEYKREVERRDELLRGADADAVELKAALRNEDGYAWRREALEHRRMVADMGTDLAKLAEKNRNLSTAVDGLADLADGYVAERNSLKAALATARAERDSLEGACIAAKTDAAYVRKEWVARVDEVIALKDKIALARGVAQCAEGQSLDNKIAEIRGWHDSMNRLAERRGEERDLARATMAEEARRIALAQPYFVDTDVGKRQEWVKQEIAEKIAKAGALPASLAVVGAAALEEVKALVFRLCTEEGQDEFISDRGHLTDAAYNAFSAAHASLLEPVKVKL